MGELGHVAHKIDDLTDVVVSEEVMGRCHFSIIIKQYSQLQTILSQISGSLPGPSCCSLCASENDQIWHSWLLKNEILIEISPNCSLALILVLVFQSNE